MNHALLITAAKSNKIKARRLTDVDPHWVSIVERPANGLPFRMMKSKEPTTERKKALLAKAEQDAKHDPELAKQFVDAYKKQVNMAAKIFDDLPETYQNELLDKLHKRHLAYIDKQNDLRNGMGVSPVQPKWKKIN